MRYLPLLLALTVPAVVAAAAPPDAWPAFRGTGDSVTDAKELPLKWSATENVAWTAELPGFGQSSPVVWKDRVFATSVEGEFKDTLHVLCLDLATGKQLWKKTFTGAIKVKTSEYVSKGAPTPVATADRVYALFETGDLIALDHAGKELWTRSLVKDFGPFAGQHGLGTSPVLAGDALLVLVAQAKSPYLLAVDAATGKDRWRVEDAFGSSWSSPTVVKAGDALTAVVSSSGLAAGFDVKTGKRLWQVDGLKGNTVASPTVFGDHALVGASDKASQLVVRLDPEVAADKRVAWRSAGPTSSFGLAARLQGSRVLGEPRGGRGVRRREDGQGALGRAAAGVVLGVADRRGRARVLLHPRRRVRGGEGRHRVRGTRPEQAADRREGVRRRRGRGRVRRPHRQRPRSRREVTPVGVVPDPVGSQL